MRSTIGTESFPIVLKVKVQAVPLKKWKGHLVLRIMLNIFSPKNMLKNYTKVEGEHKPSLGEQRISKGIEEEKNF